jgi:hypothetical protein
MLLAIPVIVTILALAWQANKVRKIRRVETKFLMFGFSYVNYSALSKDAAKCSQSVG